MIKKIRVEQLTPGMFIHDFNCGWMNHPFVGSTAKVKDENTIEKVVASGIKEVYIDTGRGLDVTDAPTEEEVKSKVQSELNKLADIKFEANTGIPLKEEIIRAKQIMKETVETMRTIMENVKNGKQTDFKKVAYIVETMTGSIIRNRDALISLLRIKQTDEYTYMHSLSVCALLISFSGHLDFNYTTTHAIGFGGLLHDIGKVYIDSAILNKKGTLSEEEFSKVKEHVKRGCRIMEQSRDILEISILLTAHHHERLNGTGYPEGLSGSEISKFGQMASIVDVYDALTSDRCYREKIHPTEALRKLFEWRGLYFNKELVEEFIRCVGIYPVGTLVRLESGLLGVVTDHGEKGLLYPKVWIVYDTKKQKYVNSFEMDLSDMSGSGTGDMIVNYEMPEKWDLRPERYLASVS